MRVWIGQEGLESDTFDTDIFGGRLYIPYSEY